MAKCIESTMSGRNLNYEYLAWIKKNADKLDLRGLTYFKSDGSIKVIAEGEEKELNIFLRILKRGKYSFPFFSSMENFAVTVQEPRNEFVDFSISETSE
jgi:acylphosphatase